MNVQVPQTFYRETSSPRKSWQAVSQETFAIYIAYVNTTQY